MIPGRSPPYVKDRLGNDTTESAYYLSANRNKRSVTIDLSQPAGIELAKKFIEKSDVLMKISRWEAWQN